jgi:hypothetical protein
MEPRVGDPQRAPRTAVSARRPASGKPCLGAASWQFLGAARKWTRFLARRRAARFCALGTSVVHDTAHSLPPVASGADSPRGQGGPCPLGTRSRGVRPTALSSLRGARRGEPGEPWAHGRASHRPVDQVQRTDAGEQLPPSRRVSSWKWSLLWPRRSIERRAVLKGLGARGSDERAARR